MKETPTPLVCRRELPADIPAIRAAETAAFGRPNEAQLVDALRSGGGLALSVVAELDGEIIGHIAYSPVTIESERGRFHALALAPVAVHPAWQRQRIGSVLIKWSLNEWQQEGHELVIVLGHPGFYARFGFVPALPLAVRCPFEVPAGAFMLLELQPGALGGHVGVVRYRDEFAEVWFPSSNTKSPGWIPSNPKVWSLVCMANPVLVVEGWSAGLRVKPSNYARDNAPEFR